jgi:anti-sigma factor RsiW
MTISDAATPPLMECRTAASALYDYLDGRLPDATAVAVQQHIETCRMCASHFDFAREVLVQVGASSPLPPVAPELRLRVIAGLRDAGYSGSAQND